MILYQIVHSSRTILNFELIGGHITYVVFGKDKGVSAHVLVCVKQNFPLLPKAGRYAHLLRYLDTGLFYTLCLQPAPRRVGCIGLHRSTPRLVLHHARVLHEIVDDAHAPAEESGGIQHSCTSTTAAATLPAR